MKINAYILAADPAWIEASVLSYYDVVEKVFVSFDSEGRGWTGAQIPVGECLERLRVVDSKKKMVFSPGVYSRGILEPMEAETRQRQCALDAAGSGVDWVLQLDTDEIVPDPVRLVAELRSLDHTYTSLDWPMRTFFQRASNGRFLEVCSFLGRTIASFPGPIAIRSGSHLKHARQSADNCVWRCDVRSVDTDPAAGHRPVHCVVEERAAVLHLSWVREEAEIWSKVTAWGHSQHFNASHYVKHVWRRAPKRWRFMFRFHPLNPRWWPALRAVDLSRHLDSAGSQYLSSKRI